MSDSSDKADYAEIDFGPESNLDDTAAMDAVADAGELGLPDDRPSVATRSRGGSMAGASGTWVHDDDDDDGSIYDTSAFGTSVGAGAAQGISEGSAAAVRAWEPDEQASGSRETSSSSEPDRLLHVQQKKVDRSFVVFVLSLIGAGIGFSFLALAALNYTSPMWLALGGIGGPATFVICHRSYKHWISNKRFNYRMLESLGEDTSDYEFEDKYRTVRTARPKA